MPKKITNFELRDAENGRVIREGDNAMLKKDGVYSVANDDGEWKPFYVVDLDAEDDPGDTTPGDTTNSGAGASAGGSTADGTGSTSSAPVPQPIPTGADVNNASELAAAVKVPGTYRLAPGNYGVLSGVTSGVHLVAADSSNKPIITRFSIRDVSDITFDGIHLLFADAAISKDSAKPFVFERVSDLKVVNCTFEGGIGDTGTAHGRAVAVISCTDVVMADNEFFLWWKGPSLGWSTRVLFERNDIHTIRSDGMSVGQDTDSIIRFNYIHDFGGKAGGSSADHKDGIQFGRSSNGGCKGTQVVDNFIDQNLGAYMQSFWGGMDKVDGSDPNDAHSGMLIRRNIIINSHKNCIAIIFTIDMVVEDNIVAESPRLDGTRPAAAKPIINCRGTNLRVIGNQAPGCLINGVQDATQEAVLDPVVVRAAARQDPRFAHFFGG